MDSELIYKLIFFTGIPVVIVSFILIKRAYDNLQSDYRRVISETSPMCIALRMLNSNYQFQDIRPELNYNITLNSKQQFDRLRLEEFFLDVIKENYTEIEQTIQNMEVNRYFYREYTMRLKGLPGPASAELAQSEFVPYKKYLAYEAELYHSLIQNPVCNVSIICTKHYRSPQGRNRYENYMVFTPEDVAIGHKKILERAEQQNSAQYQRSLMTLKLRYQIMQRDHFRCVLCGRDSSSGNLEIDHIKPVSKGGKTEASNLRTLCRDCNRGKSDSFIPNEVN